MNVEGEGVDKTAGSRKPHVRELQNELGGPGTTTNKGNRLGGQQSLNIRHGTFFFSL